MNDGFCPRCAVFWALALLSGWLGLRWFRGEEVSSGVVAVAATITAYHGFTTWVDRRYPTLPGANPPHDCGCAKRAVRPPPVPPSNVVPFPPMTSGAAGNGQPWRPAT